jgi:hypothetical protein
MNSDGAEDDSGTTGTDQGSKMRIPRSSLFVMDSTDEQYYLKNFNLGLEEALNAARARMIEIERVRQTE